MAHLVTGYAGKEHITSADQGSFNASFFGTGQFVMEAGRQFGASIVDNNTVRVFDGDMLMQGRHIRIPPDAYEDMAIGTGTAGKNRTDIICMTYEKNVSDGTERAYLEVVRGMETEGEPVPPQYVEGNILEGAERNQMPLYLVELRGVVLSGIACMFQTITTYQTLAEKYEEEFLDACRNFLGSLIVFDTMSGIDGNTEQKQLAGALALKEFHDSYKALIGTGDISKIGGGTVLGAIMALSRIMGAATDNAAGKAGLAPAPPAGAQGKYLRGDGTWQMPPDTTYGAATQSAAGLMSAADKKKLDGVAAGANAYAHPTSSGSKHIPSGGSSGQILRWSADGTAAWGADNNTTYGVATTTSNGLMSAADKASLNTLSDNMPHKNTYTNYGAILRATESGIIFHANTKAARYGKVCTLNLMIALSTTLTVSVGTKNVGTLIPELWPAINVFQSIFKGSKFWGYISINTSGIVTLEAVGASINANDYGTLLITYVTQ